MSVCYMIFMMRNTLSLVSPEDDSIDSIADEIAELSALIGAATHRLICLIGELDRRDGWVDPVSSTGFRSCAHWLSWRVGLSLGTARQYVRIAKALPDLARISAAFGAGELSYSKVRAVTRIATPENEEMLLGMAREGTAAQVERVVRDFRRADSRMGRDWTSRSMMAVEAPAGQGGRRAHSGAYATDERRRPAGWIGGQGD
ncbi:MAG: DUF222 domain-containing protein [Pseudomonadota bacterium]